MKTLKIICALILLISQHAFSQLPNILWITIEDTSPQFIGSYGSKISVTPNMDQFTEEGVQFINAFSTGTVCSPSRSAIITGLKTYELGTGNHRSNYSIPEWVKGFPFYMKQNGYYVTNNSKTDYNVADEKDFIAETWDESSGKAGWWNREEGSPFFSVFNFNESHQSRTMTNPYEWYLNEVLEKLPQEERIGENEFDMPPFYRDSPDMRKQMARVYNSLKLTDNRIGEVINRLKSEGLLDDTIIFIFADHGEGMPRGKTNGINFGYRVPFTIWFPPKYEYLSPWPMGAQSEELISFEDLAPTLVSLSGGEVPTHMKGRVLMGKNRSKEINQLFLSSDRSDNGIDMVRSVTDGKYVYSRNYMPYMSDTRYIRYMEIGEIKQVMRADYENGMLDSLQSSILEPRASEVLYDIENDIWETRNLINHPEYQVQTEKFRTELTLHLIERRDVLMLPEYELEKISENSTPYEFRENNNLYPVEKIYEAVKISGLRGEKEMRQQLELLKSENRIVRYWASIGLKSQYPEKLMEHLDELMEHVKDAYPPVSITVSSIVYNLNQDRGSKEVLEKYVLSDNRHLSLMAINYLIYIHDKSPFIEAVTKVYERQGEYNTAAASKDFLGSLGLIPNTFEFR